MLGLIKTNISLYLNFRDDHDTVLQYGPKFAVEQNLSHLFLLLFFSPSHFSRSFQAKWLENDLHRSKTSVQLSISNQPFFLTYLRSTLVPTKQIGKLVQTEMLSFRLHLQNPGCYRINLESTCTTAEWCYWNCRDMLLELFMPNVALWDFEVS